MRTPKPKMTGDQVANLINIIAEGQIKGVIRIYALGLIETEQDVFETCHNILNGFEFKLRTREI